MKRLLAAVTRRPHESGTLEHPDVPADTLERHGQGCGDVRNTGQSTRQRGQSRAVRGHGDRTSFRAMAELLPRLPALGIAKGRLLPMAV